MQPAMIVLAKIVVVSCVISFCLTAVCTFVFNKGFDSYTINKIKRIALSAWVKWLRSTMLVIGLMLAVGPLQMLIAFLLSMILLLKGTLV